MRYFRLNSSRINDLLALRSAIFFATAVIVSGFQQPLVACYQIDEPQEVRTTEDVRYSDLRTIRTVDPNNVPEVSVEFEATVTYVDPMLEFLFVQEGQDAIFVFRPEVSAVSPGQRVSVRGRLAKGDLLPIVSNPVVTVIGTGAIPTPINVTQIGEEHDCQYAAIEYEILQTIVGVEYTMLYARTKDDKDVYIQVQHRDGVAFPNASEIAGHRVRCTGALGLQILGGAFLKPGEDTNRIVGHKVYCNTPDDLEIVDKNKLSDSAPVAGLSFLIDEDFPDGRFLTFANICMIDYDESPEFVACDGLATVRFKLSQTDDLRPGMVVRIGGIKSTDSSGRQQFKADHLRYLNHSIFSLPEAQSIQQAVATFKEDERITVEGTPQRIEDRKGVPYLILAEGGSSIAVHFQDDAIDSLTTLDPAIAAKVRITGVSQLESEEDDTTDFQLVVVRSQDVQLIASKTSLSRMVVIGLGVLLGICALAALWIRLLKSQVSQKQRFEAIFDNAGCPIIVFNGNLQIDDANQVGADLTGYSKDEMRKMSVSQIDPFIPAEKIKAMLVHTMNSQQVSVFETKICTKDNRTVDVEVHCRNLLKSEDPDKATYITVFPDLTARIKQANELKEARDEAIKANKAKSRFVASMSHELRTPLNGVIGMTQLLENTDLTPTQADYLAACRTSGETLLTVIGDVLDFSKMEAGKLELKAQETKLIPFVENVVRATSLQQGTRHVDLASFVDPHLNRSVMVDSDRLRQVLFNLIGNAAKFTAEGSITVTAKF